MCASALEIRALAPLITLALGAGMHHNEDEDYFAEDDDDDDELEVGDLNLQLSGNLKEGEISLEEVSMLGQTWQNMILIILPTWCDDHDWCFLFCVIIIEANLPPGIL